MTEIIKITKIDWQSTLIGMEVGDKIEHRDPTIQDHGLIRTWASKVKRETGNVYKVTLNDNIITITRVR